MKIHHLTHKQSDLINIIVSFSSAWHQALRASRFSCWNLTDAVLILVSSGMCESRAQETVLIHGLFCQLFGSRLEQSPLNNLEQNLCMGLRSSQLRSTNNNKKKTTKKPGLCKDLRSHFPSKYSMLWVISTHTRLVGFTFLNVWTVEGHQLDPLALGSSFLLSFG